MAEARAHDDGHILPDTKDLTSKPDSCHLPANTRSRRFTSEGGAGRR